MIRARFNCLINCSFGLQVEKTVYFNNQAGETLAATLHLPGNASDRGVVLGHCFTCSRHTGILRQLASDLNQAGHMALRFDFSGNGQSQGIFAESTYSKQIEEMKLAADLLKAEGARWIGMAGHSMGALIAMLTAAASDDIRAVAAVAGRMSGIQALHFLNAEQRKQLRQTGRVYFESRGRSLELTDRFFADADHFNPPQVLATLKIPLLIVHGDQDDIIPVQEAYRARQYNPDAVELDIIPGADHMFSQTELRRQASRNIVAFFRKHASH